MTKLLEKVLEAVKRLPAERQDEIAGVIMAEMQEPLSLSDTEKAAIERGRAAAHAGDFASDDEVAAILHRLRTV